jgi:hypothetical protein
MALPRVPFAYGQLWTTSTGRTVEILAVDDVDEENDHGEYHVVNVIAYRYVGGSGVHLRAASRTNLWTLVNTD